MLETPVALVVYNRPGATDRVVERLRGAQPRRVFVVADGPRPGDPNDAARCADVLAVVDKLDADCVVSLCVAEQNMGCGARVRSGLAWLFQQVEQAIILEDDCLPDPSFFDFAQAMLGRYAANNRVWFVSGRNALGVWHADRQSHHFSRFGQKWGWATWRRAWRRYDDARPSLDRAATLARLRQITGDDVYSAELLRRCRQVARGDLDTWDYHWQLGQLLADGLAVVPAINLVRNIGFERQATHTRLSHALDGQLEESSLAPPYAGPAATEPDAEFDCRMLDYARGQPPAELVLGQAARQIESGRYSLALLLLEAMRRNGRGLSQPDRERLASLRERALTALKRRPDDVQSGGGSGQGTGAA